MLFLLCSLNNQKFNCENLISIMYQPIYAKITTFMSKIYEIFGENIKNTLKEQDILANNCINIVQFFAYIYTAKHKISIFH